MTAEVLRACVVLSGDAKTSRLHVWFTAVHDNVRAPLERVLYRWRAEGGVNEQPAPSLVHLVRIVLDISVKGV